MIAMSVIEFKRYVENLHPHKIIFSTENQSFLKGDCPVKMVAVFPAISITVSPDEIYLANQYVDINLTKIKRICICDESLLGQVWNVVCDNKNSDVNFTLIAS